MYDLLFTAKVSLKREVSTQVNQAAVVFSEPAFVQSASSKEALYLMYKKLCETKCKSLVDIHTTR
jgi:hypothetical protein